MYKQIITNPNPTWHRPARMASKNNTSSVNPGHSMGNLMVDFQVPLIGVCLASLLFGLPLIFNMMWHLRVANNNSGRGTLRVIRLHTLLNLCCAPLIWAQLVMLSHPSKEPGIPFLK